MKIQKIQPKKKEEVALSASFKKSFSWVHEKVLRKDWEAVEENDDCIQDESISGGLWDKKSGKYGFSFYPAKGSEARWDFECDVDFIKGVAEGRINSMVLWACQVGGCGKKFDNTEGICVDHDFYDDGKKEAIGYPVKMTEFEIEDVRKLKAKKLMEFLKGLDHSIYL